MIPSPLRIKMQRALKAAGFTDSHQRANIIGAIIPVVSEALRDSYTQGERTEHDFPRSAGG